MSNETTDNGNSWPADQMNLTHYLDGTLVPTAAPVSGSGTFDAQGLNQVSIQKAISLLAIFYLFLFFRILQEEVPDQQSTVVLEQRKHQQLPIQEELKIHQQSTIHLDQHQSDLVDLAWLPCRIEFDLG